MIKDIDNAYSLGVFENYNLRHNLEGFYGNYGCSVLYDDGASKNEIRHKLKIKFIGNVSEFENWYRIERDSKIYINDILLDSFMDTLAFEVGQVLYPLEINTTYNGVLSKILNYTEIVNRWEKEKVLIHKKYKGKIVDDYVALADKTLKSEDILFKKITSDWFLNLYFSDLYKFYSPDLYVDDKMYYPLLGDTNHVRYETVSKIEIEKEVGRTDVRVNIKGTINDERCALDLEQKLDEPYYGLLNKEEKVLKGTCDITYLLDEKTGVIEGVEAVFYTKFKNPKKVLVKMFLVEQLKGNEIEEEGNPNLKKGFWSKLFKGFKI